MNLILIKYFVFILFLGILIPEKENLIWNENSKLTWDNFKGTVDTLSEKDAATKTRIEINVSTSKKEIEFYIPAYFETKKSWVKNQNDNLLKHEQGHFDIAEIAARNLRKAVSENPYSKNTNLKEIINKLYKKNIDFLVSYQNKYDKETNHSKNDEYQQLWDIRIKELLKNLEKFKTPKFKVQYAI